MRTIYDFKDWLVWEQEPVCRSVRIVSPRLGIDRDYFLSFPYMVYSKGVIRGCIFFQVGFCNYTQEGSPDIIQFYIPPLPNVYENGEVCLGEAYDEMADFYYPNMEDISLGKLIELFWLTEFTEEEDVWEPTNQAIALFGKDPYSKWELLSKNDPNFVLSVNWGEVHIGLGPLARSANFSQVEWQKS